MVEADKTVINLQRPIAHTGEGGRFKGTKLPTH